MAFAVANRMPERSLLGQQCIKTAKPLYSE